MQSRPFLNCLSIYDDDFDGYCIEERETRKNDFKFWIQQFVSISQKPQPFLMG